MPKISFYQIISWSLFFIIWIAVYMTWSGRGLPPENELRCITGNIKPIVVSSSPKKDINHIQITNPQTKQSLVVACGYSVVPKISMSNCALAKELPRKDITIGYYHQPSVLWFKNDIPQMAVMKTNNTQDSINGNYSYNSIQTKISVFNLISVGVAIFLSAVCLFDIIFKRKSKKKAD